MKSISFSSVKIDTDTFKNIADEISMILSDSRCYDHYIVSGNVKIVPLISPGGKKENIRGFSNGLSFKPCQKLKELPAINNFLNSLPGKKLSCRVSIMEGKTEILPHRDYFRSMEFGVVRLHLPIFTDKRITFSLDNKAYHFKKGYLYYVDISKLHQLKNPLNKSRVHLIIDLEVTEELLKMFDVQDLKKELNYLNLSSLDKWYMPDEMSFSMPIDKIPYPLTLSTEKWKLEKFKNKWYLKSKSYSYAISVLSTGHFYLDALGPGFYFFIKKNSLHFSCSGITSVSKKGIIKITRSFVVKREKPFKQASPFFKRSLNFIPIKHFSDELVLVKKDEPSLLYFLNGQSKILWKKQFFKVSNNKELKEAQQMTKLGILDRVHPFQLFSHNPSR